MSDMRKKAYKVVSLFSGAMGLDIGLEQTGRFRVVACVENQHAFCNTIRANHCAGRLCKELQIFERDVTELDPEEVLRAVGLEPGELDLLAGGPACQSFRTAGRRRTVRDHRGTLLWQFLRFVEAMRPRFFVMENVRGLLSAALRHRPIAGRPEKGGPPLSSDEQPGSVVRAFAEDLQKMKGGPYHMDCFEVNAVNYGAPQLRERALFIGNRYNAVVDFPNPTHGPPRRNAPRQRTLFEEGAGIQLRQGFSDGFNGLCR
jgi:DNA (cytosine-5)-methyltransferase 1